ncbi:MAG TPA: peptidyl-prolyl cis-trans isomerase [Terriglobia bacterium]|jgi:peptidyl-prolyl cis-trans isomerase D
MLDFMRRQQSNLKWIWIILIFVFSVSLVALYIPLGDLPSVNLTGDVASIGHDSISAKEFQTAYRNYVDRMRGQINPEMLKAFRFDRQIMDALVTRHVVTEEAKRLGLNVTPAEIEQKILENAVFRENGAFIGQDRYQAILAQNNLTVEDFESNVANEILTDKLKSFITAAVSVSDKDVEEEYKRRNEKAKLDYFVIDASKLESKVTVSDQDEKDYYEKNKAKYTVPEKRKARYIFLESLKLRADIKVTDDELRQYYEQHKNEYTLPERVKAQHILFKTQGKTPEEIAKIKEKAQMVLERAKKGEDFGMLAKEYSEDATAKSGGDLGDFGRGQMVPEFEKVAFSLGVGAISDLVQSQAGIHIIKVNGKQEARVRPFEEMKEAIRPIVETRKAEQKASDLAQQIAVDLVNNKNLDAVAAKYNAQVKETPLVEQGTPIPELGNAAELEKKMFGMAKGEIGTAVQVDRGFVVPQLSDIAPSHPASFDEARSKVAEDVKTEKAKQLAADKAKQIEDMLKSGKDLAAAAKAVGADVKTSDMLTRGASLPEFGSIAELDKEMFTLPLGKPGSPVTVAGKTLAFDVKERKEISPDEMKKSLDMVRNEMLPERRDEYFNAYIQEVKKRMETGKQIKINDSVVNQLAQQIS